MNVKVRDEEAVEKPAEHTRSALLQICLRRNDAYKNAPIAASVYRGSRKPPRSIAVRNERWPEVGSLVRMVTQEIMSSPSRMKPTMRTAQPNPTMGISFSRMMGRRTPPLALPPVVTPIASARRFLNQCPRTATAGLNLSEVRDDEQDSQDDQGRVDVQEGNAEAE